MKSRICIIVESSSVLAATIFLLLGLIIIASGCKNETVQKIKERVAGEETLIKGPKRGKSGNDSDNTFRSLTISPSNPDEVYIGSEGNGIFKSTDGGKNWKWLRKGLKNNEGTYAETYDMVIDSENESLIYAAFTSGPELTKKTYSGQVVTGGVYASTDAGNSWKQSNKGLPNSAVTSIALDPVNPKTIYDG